MISRTRTSIATIMWLASSTMLFAPLAEAQVPSITSLSPQAVKPGESIDVTLKGTNLVGAKALWTSFEAKSVLSPDVKDNGKNKAQAVFRINVSEDAPVGVHGIRVATPNGTSELKLIVVDDIHSVAQQSGNTSKEKAQTVSLPVAIDGSVASLNRQYFRFPAKAGQRLSFEVLARRIGSPLDPMFVIYDPAGREVAYSEDALGLGGDAQTSHIFENGGDHLLELRDIQYRGAANYNFRLRIGDFPCVTTPYPMGAQRGKDAALSFAGSDIDSLQRVDVRVPADPKISALAVGVKRAGGNISGLATLAVGSAEEAVESEPNNETSQATRVILGAQLNGRLNEKKDVDRFVFAAKKGQKFLFREVTRSQSSPCDLVLNLYDAKGKRLAGSKDADVNESAFTYTFPADGDYNLSVKDLNQRGGSAFSYRVSVKESKPGFSLTAATSTINVPAGGTTSVEVKAARTAYNGPITISVAGLPKGITSMPTVIGPGLNSVLLTLTGATDAAAGNISAIQILGSAKIGKADITATASISSALKAKQNNMPLPPPILAHATALAVGPKAAFALQATPSKIVVKKKGKATVKISVLRQAGTDETITLALNTLPKGNPSKGGLPTGLTAAVKPIPKGANETQIVFSTTDKTPVGLFTATLVATHKKGKATTTASVPGIMIEVQK